jgi:DNA polymerase-3 subunit delta'
MEELGNRLGLLNEDPYELADFSHRPSLTDQESTKNKQSFYPIDFFHEEIRPKAFLKPNEGNKTVIILTEIETMRKEAANAFLKLLEEPSENIVFLLTTNSTDALLPTIISRCQQIKLNTLPTKTIKNALIEHDNVPEDDAAYLARICGGNYTMARFFDTETLKETRGEVIEYLRNAFTQDAVKLIETAKNWQNKQNINGQIATLNVLETFLRDLLIYRSTQDKSLLVNADQIETIQKFCTKLGDARLEEMIAQIEQCRTLIYQNVQPKLVFATLSLRFSNLMRDFDLPIAENESWKHLPAYID